MRVLSSRITALLLVLFTVGCTVYPPKKHSKQPPLAPKTDSSSADPVAVQKSPSLSPETRPYRYLMAATLLLNRVTAALLSAGQARAEECKAKYNSVQKYNDCLRPYWLSFQAWRNVGYPKITDIIQEIHKAVDKKEKDWEKDLYGFLCALRYALEAWKPYMGGQYEKVMAPYMKLPIKCPVPDDGKNKKNPAKGVATPWYSESPKISTDFGI